MMRRRRATGVALAATAAIVVGTFGVASATTPPDSGAAAGSAPAAADPCASTTATTEPAATEAPATTAAAGTAAPAATAAPTTEPAPVATEAPAPTEARETVPPVVTELDSTSAIDINAQPRDALQQGGEFRLDVGDFADNWNPFNPLGNNSDYTKIMQPMWNNGPWDFAADGTATLDPNFAVSSSTSDGTSGQPFTVTYQLNPDAKWNNGDPIDADDYIANWHALNGVDFPDFPNIVTEGYDRITSVEAGADKFEVVITFDDVYPDYQALFSPVLPAESVQPDTYVDGWTELNMDWFAGPFIVDSIDTTQGILTEVPNPNWWGDKPLLDKLIFRVVSPDAVPTAYANGELDAFDIGVDPNGFQIANTTPGGTVRAAAGPNWRHITFNTTAGLLADQTIRQAIVRSLDREDIGSSDLAGIPWPAKPLNNHIFVENQAGYVDNAGDFAFDPDRAMSDLDAAGWVAGSDGIREKDGQRLTVNFSQLVGVPVSENEARLVQSQLAEVGIEVNIVDVPIEDFNNVLDTRDFQLIAFTWVGTPFPFRFDQIFGNCSDSNYSSSYIPGFDELVNKIGSTLDIVERTALANQADVMLWDYVSTLPLYQRPDLAAINANVANYGAFGFQTPVKWEDVGWMS